MKSCVLLLSIAIAIAPMFAQDPPEPEQIDVPQVNILVIRPNVGQWGGLNAYERPNALEKNHRIAFELYSGAQVTELASDVKTFPTTTYPSLAAALQGQEFQLIYFTGGSLIERITPEDIAAIIAQMESRPVTIVGTASGANLLLQKLGMQFGVPVMDQVGQLFFTRKGTQTRKDFMLLQEPTTTSGALFEKLWEWKHRTDPRAMGGSAWSAIYANQWSGTMSGGEWALNVTVYKFDSNPTYDYYRVDGNIFSSINNYSKEKWHCGWYTGAMVLRITKNPSTAGVLYEYMPTGTVHDVTQGFSIGGSIGTDSAGFSAEYSYSYGGPEVTVTDRSSKVNARGDWTITFNGPAYSQWPWYPGPALTARSSYFSQPSTLFQVPKGSGLHFTVWENVMHRYDNLDCGFLCFTLNVSHQDVNQSQILYFDFQ